MCPQLLELELELELMLVLMLMLELELELAMSPTAAARLAAAGCCPPCCHGLLTARVRLAVGKMLLVGSAGGAALGVTAAQVPCSLPRVATARVGASDGCERQQADDATMKRIFALGMLGLGLKTLRP